MTILLGGVVTPVNEMRKRTTRINQANFYLCFVPVDTHGCGTSCATLAAQEGTRVSAPIPASTACIVVASSRRYVGDTFRLVLQQCELVLSLSPWELTYD